jgi:DNA topoisomerase III
VLAMIVNRDDQIRHFQIEPFWELFTKYRNVIFTCKGGRYKSNEEGEIALKEVLGHPFNIENVNSKKENEYPPQLYDLTELQKDMNRKHGLSAAETLEITQTLYEQKLITYPRTDSRYLTADLKPQVLQTLENLKPIWKKEIDPLNLENLPFSPRIINDKKVNDHHAIIPTGKHSKFLPVQSQAVYNAIVLRLIAIFYNPCIKEITTVEGNSNKVPFQTKGIKIVSEGWTVLYPKKTDEKKLEGEQQEIQLLPMFQKGESGPHFPYIKEGKTTPPSHFNENALLAAMETAGKYVDDENLREILKEKGLGTPATRASIIEILLKRGYIERDRKFLKATDSGRYLIAFIQDRSLKSPELTGEWEAKLKLIEKGKFNAGEFMQQITHFIAQIINESDITKINYDTFGNCPKCKNPVIKGKRGYGCSKWKEGCSFVLWNQYKNFELNEGQIRTLLQKKILLQPLGGMVLSFSESGILTEIPQLKEKMNHFKKSYKGKGNSYRSRAKPKPKT